MRGPTRTSAIRSPSATRTTRSGRGGSRPSTAPTFVETYEEVCRHPDVDFVDVCTFPDFRLQPLEICAAHGKHIQVQKPMSISLDTARRMIETARAAGIQLGVVSQHRFDVASDFMLEALEGRAARQTPPGGRVREVVPLGRVLLTAGEGELADRGGRRAHQPGDSPGRHPALAGRAGARRCSPSGISAPLHKIESEDMVTAVLRYGNGAAGVIQASTAFWPGYPERIEFHGTKGTAVITGDKLTAWDVRDDDEGDRPPLAENLSSGASDPMAISVDTFERQFLDFGEAIRDRPEAARRRAKKATRRSRSSMRSIGRAALEARWFYRG